MLGTDNRVAIYPVGRQLHATVPWEGADNVQAHLRRHGIRATLHLDPRNRVARIEPWAGTDPQKFQLVLAGWTR